MTPVPLFVKAGRASVFLFGFFTRLFIKLFRFCFCARKIFAAETFLSLHPARAVALHERFRFRGAHKVHVAGYRVFERRRRHGEFQRLFEIFIRQQAVDKPCGERIAAAHSVHNAHVVAARTVKFLSVVRSALQPLSLAEKDSLKLVAI